METKTVIKNVSKRIALLGILTALYIVLSLTVKIPFVSHITLDLGYIVFAIACVTLGWQGVVVGAVGCILESVLFSGMFPVGWLPGQVVIGLMVGIACPLINKSKMPKWAKTVCNSIVIALAVVIGILVIKTIVECSLFHIPYAVKIPKNGIACVVDVCVMLVGYGLCEILLANKYVKNLLEKIK